MVLDLDFEQFSFNNRGEVDGDKKQCLYKKI